MHNRPSIDDYFLGIAKVVSKRSRDPQTQHGCVLVNPRGKIIGTGYNSFPRGMDDASLPTSRPDKYPWMKHSERNALLNAAVTPAGSTAYVTGPCCYDCLSDLHQAEVEKVICNNAYKWQKDDELELYQQERFQKDTGFTPQFVKADLSWLVDMVLDDPELRKIAIDRLQNESV